ncbi:MAG: autotransporter outer membrane beta-barrel domain-containing protein [Phascolarctobacterium sp.]|uniref:autotransporter outer membrane beta-barrel domain-containing protein n=1 Tax=Phascolarctobacterium sp. TaxID=2049039 RepID=UPI0025D5F43F|nr:autotransporter outer membrane beta-barrel domain-containing protein [Phascolarctobacterium sp.]MCC8159030.1 autotransporter outer membrane beta-barrel domain-containing protein [Phascolarctobacterium sp.]
MSRKESLTKKIAHTLLAMSIVYSSGINIVVNEVYAAETTENITSSGGTFTETGADGTDSLISSPGPVTDGESAAITGKITDGNISNAIEVTATGGRGGDETDGINPTVMAGAKGGDAAARVTVDESLSSVETGNITVTATGGRNGSVYQGVSQVAGAAAAYGIEVKHDLTITAADITVSAKSEFNLISTNKVDIGGAKHSKALAAGLQVDDGKVIFSGGKMKVSAQSSHNVFGLDEVAEGATKFADGGDAEAYGIRVTGGEATATLTGILEIESAEGSRGNGRLSGEAVSGLTHTVDGGAGGNAVAYGFDINGGIAHLDLQDISIKQSGDSNYISGGAGGDAAGTAVESVATGHGGTGGNANVAGVHIVSGKADGTIGNIAIETFCHKASGGKGGAVINSLSGSGGAGGNFYVAGISNTGGEVELTVAGMDIKAAGGNGGALGTLTVTDASKVTAAGAVQAFAGKGGEALVVGVDNRGGSSKVTVTGDIKLAATGGSGGSGNINADSAGKVTDEAAQILVTERVSGAGGEAMAVGLQNTGGSLTADVQKLEITATGGFGGSGISTYGNINGASAGGGAAAAYGINVLGGLAEQLTVAEITVEANGGSSNQVQGSNAMNKVNNDGAGIVGGKGGQGGVGAAYGVSNSGGSVGLTVAKITVVGIGGDGGQGGSVYKDGSATAAGTGGDGGNGGNAYAYGVFGTGSGSQTAIAVDQIIAEAKAGAGGKGAAVGNGVATAGQDGQQGEAAEAYGVYAEKGAVITLNAKTEGGAITIGAKAGNTATPEGSKAYAIYADNATVLFNDNAVLSSSDGTDINAYDVLTGLNNATLGFGTPAEGQEVGRTINGGTLQLEGSNTFKVATDLANNKADSFKFDSLAGGTATQYITVGYDKAFDGSKLDSFVGDVTVLTITNLGAGQNLNNFVGKESEMDDPLTRFLATPTIEVDKNNVKITKIDFAEAGASETVMTAADAQMSIGNLWRIEGNNLMKRMGDLRSDPEAAEGGVWARYYRGELNADSAYDRSFDQDYTAFQGGIDKVQDYKGGKLYTGIAVNRIDSNAGYNSGSGDLSSTGVGLYASWLGSKGHYLDVIARGSKLANDFKLVDKSGNTAKGDYDTWAYGISAEYGYRQDLQGGWFVEPQAELSLGRIGSADYTMSNGTEISQDAVNSAVTRIGVLSGKEFTMNGRQGNAYVKASLLHDFGGNGGGAAYYNGRSTVVESADMNGTWYEIGLGANLGLDKNSNLYFDALKTFGGDLRTEWQFNAGLRFTF